MFLDQSEFVGNRDVPTLALILAYSFTKHVLEDLNQVSNHAVYSHTLQNAVGIESASGMGKKQNAKLDVVVLRMQEDLVPRRVKHHLLLQLGHGVGNLDTHARWATDKNTGPSAKVLREIIEHLRDIGTEIVCPPIVSSHGGLVNCKVRGLTLWQSFGAVESKLKVAVIG